MVLTVSQDNIYNIISDQMLLLDCKHNGGWSLVDSAAISCPHFDTYGIKEHCSIIGQGSSGVGGNRREGDHARTASFVHCFQL